MHKEKINVRHREIKRQRQKLKYENGEVTLR